MSNEAAFVGQIVHSVGVRYRVRGSGHMETRLWNMDRVRYLMLDEIDLDTPSSRTKTLLANFQDQGIQIQFRTTRIDEYISINKIVCFVKPVAESYPIRSGG